MADFVAGNFECHELSLVGVRKNVFYRTNFTCSYVLIVELLILNVDINQNISTNINNERHTFFTKFSLGLSRFRG